MTVCQWCGGASDFKQISECHRCHVARAALDKALESLPYLAARRLTEAAAGRLRSLQQQDFARQNPDHYEDGWLKRKAERRELRRASQPK